MINSRTRGRPTSLVLVKGLQTVNRVSADANRVLALKFVDHDEEF